ncbi:hypothetical protein D5086_011567 [Populus alba]|uniref:Uncharacterized protein n=1 Tax=Populus alba TaxID=43335 RepID=A0ACC4CCL1_POPAL
MSSRSRSSSRSQGMGRSRSRSRSPRDRRFRSQRNSYRDGPYRRETHRDRDRDRGFSRFSSVCLDAKGAHCDTLSCMLLLSAPHNCSAGTVGNLGMSGHRAKDCPNPEPSPGDVRLCNNCYKPGHFAADCTNDKACGPHEQGLYRSHDYLPQLRGEGPQGNRVPIRENSLPKVLNHINAWAFSVLAFNNNGEAMAAVELRGDEGTNSIADDHTKVNVTFLDPAKLQGSQNKTSNTEAVVNYNKNRLVSLLGPALSLSTGHPLGTLISHKLPHMTLMDPIGLEPIHGWLESWPKSRICSHQVRLWILTRPATRYQGNRPNFKENSVRRKEIKTKTS